MPDRFPPGAPEQIKLSPRCSRPGGSSTMAYFCKKKCPTNIASMPDE